MSGLLRTARIAPTTFGEELPDVVDTVTPEDGYQLQWLKAAMLQLPPRKQTILIAWLYGHTYAEVGELNGVSRARAHQEVTAALAILQEWFDGTTDR